MASMTPMSMRLSKKRIDNFKTSGRDIQAIFKTHLGAGDFAAIEAAATKMADWPIKCQCIFPKAAKAKAPSLQFGKTKMISQIKRQPMQQQRGI